MNSFGLGLILDFTDNASAGMSSAAANLKNLSDTADNVAGSLGNSSMNMYAVAQSMVQVGTTASNAGRSILNVFETMGKKVIDTGNTMLSFRMTLSALYGDNGAEEKIKQIKQYAATSVFQVKDIMSTVTMMKAVGIEAMDNLSSSSGKTTQKLMDYASDLAAMMPNMHNTYGTGVQAAMGAFKEYIAEGNALSLKRGAGLDITSILGEKKGSTMEERKQQVADLIEKMGIAGYTAKLAGTPMQQLSNIQDVFFNTLSDIANSGAFDKFCKLLSTASDFIQGLTKDEKRYTTITKLVSDVVSALINPLQKLVNMLIKAANAFLDFAGAHPVLAKLIALAATAVGILLMLSGTVLKFSGNILMLIVSIKALGGGASILKVIAAGFKVLGSTLLWVVALAFILYEAYKHNLFGLRDLVTKVTNVFKVLFDAISDGALSMENYDLAKKMGILPFVEAVLNAKYLLGTFFDGIKTGLASFSGWLDKFSSKLSGSSGWLGKLGTELKKVFNPESADKWNKVGEVIGKVLAGIAVAVVVVVSLVVKIVEVIIAIVKVAVAVITVAIKIVVAIIKAVIAVVKGIIAVVEWVFNAVVTVIHAIATAVMFIVHIVVGIALAIYNAVKSVIMFIVDIVIDVINFIVGLFATIWKALVKFFTPIATWIYSNIIQPIVNFVTMGWNTLVQVFTTIVTWIYNNIIQPIVTFIQTLWNDIVTVFSTLANWVYGNIIAPIIALAQMLWNGVTAVIHSIWSTITSIFGTIANWVYSNVIAPIVTFFQGLWTDISGIVNNVKDTIVSAFTSAYDAVTGVWAKISDFFSKLFGEVSDWVAKITAKGQSLTGLGGHTPAAATGVDSFVGGLIQVNEKGGELINLPSGSSVIPHDKSIEESMKKGVLLGTQTMSLYAARASSPMSQNTAETESAGNDYSVTFAAGSVVIQLANSSDAELERAADKLMKIIERKQQLKSMAQRQTRASLNVK